MAQAKRNSTDTRRSKAEKTVSRRTQIAEAVIRIIGEQGIRAVSHRRVDRFLGLSEGSTSPYFPKTVDLLNAGLSQLDEYDAKSLKEVTAAVLQRSEDSGLLHPRDVAKMIYEMWLQAMKPNYRYLLMARFEYILLANREPEFQISNSGYFERTFELDKLLFEKMGARSPQSAAIEYGIFRRGLWFTILVAPSSMTNDLSPEYFETQILRFIHETS